MARIEVCRVDELRPGEARRVEIGDGIALFNVDGAFYATQDLCTHGQSSLAEGWLEGDTVECAWHMAKFCVKTGRALCLPATQPLRTFSVSVVGDTIVVEADG
jgi:3-phenylpropionate/trans-cinnamate dioxygenase ferredoxin subunit